MTKQLIKYFTKQHAGKPFVMGQKNDMAACMGSRCDFYIYISFKGRSYYSDWMKGREASTFWDECMAINGQPSLFNKLMNQYQCLGPIKFGAERA